ncbi:LysR family transcriptional regulator [Bordetella hinzii]|uniref:LysR substrate-binding domain-containing protein n=1 Tax=Bordetella hinzii TaxID=103855 RepID=UPI0013EFF4E3|nr:LysR substrate-binding domain-containing protein [Bordetella hinzii]QII84391.1 LysR family transcriptional regulator [Bordetella hinzii]
MSLPPSYAGHTPPLAALRAFEAVARLGSLSRAAVELNVTKSAISHQLRALEADLGVVLLNRGGGLRQAELTGAGADLLGSVQQALALLATACRNTRAAAQGRRRQRLNISVNPSLGALWLAPRIGRFIALHPGIDVQVFLHASQDPAWQTQALDLAFLHVRDMGPRGPLPGDLPLLAESVVPVCSPSLIAPRSRDDPRALLAHRWLEEKHVDSPETDWRTWRQHLGLMDQAAPEPLVFSGLSTVVAAAVAGVGIALGRSPLVDEELAAGRLVPLVPRARLAGSWGYVMRLARDGGRASVALPALVEFLAEEGRASFELHARCLPRYSPSSVRPG